MLFNELLYDYAKFRLVRLLMLSAKQANRERFPDSKPTKRQCGWVRLSERNWQPRSLFHLREC